MGFSQFLKLCTCTVSCIVLLLNLQKCFKDHTPKSWAGEKHVRIKPTAAQESQSGSWLRAGKVGLVSWGNGQRETLDHFWAPIASMPLWPEPQVMLLKVGVWLLATQKQGWWKGKFGLFWMLAIGVGGSANSCPKANPLQPPGWQSVGKSFYRQREKDPCRNSTVSCDSHLEIGHQCSEQRFLDCFKYG